MEDKYQTVESFDSVKEIMKYMDYCPPGTTDEEKLDYLIKFVLVAIIEFSV